jgi:putative PEP-CTERM system histidine kinase
MILSSVLPLGIFLVAALTWLMGCWLFIRRETTPSYLGLAVLLGVVSLAHIGNGLGAWDDAHRLLWQRLVLAAELFQPAAIFFAGIQFLNPAEQREMGSRYWTVRILTILGLLLAVLTLTEYVLVEVVNDGGEPIIILGAWGQVPYVFIVLATALGLAQLELVLRASSEPIRYRLKFLVIGLGGLAGYQIYHASEMLLLLMWRPEQVFVSGVVACISLGLLSLGIVRSRFKSLLVNAYVSPQALFGAVTLIAIGLYLLVVGMVGEWLRRINQPLGAEFGVIVAFGALMALTAAMFSKSVRAEVRRLVTRNFYRSKYDYRAEWLRVTEAFQLAATKEAILDRLLDVLIKTFSTTAIVIWVFREADRRYFQARPVISETSTVESTHPVIRQILDKDKAVFVSEIQAGPVDAADPLVRMGAELCFPIHIQGQPMAFVALGRQSHGEPYGTDDCDLLYGICHHVGTLLSQAVLAEERQASAELEALHRFSVFCLHDLKNLAARLSLVAQNAEHHGHDPAFQESALRTVADTAMKMTGLMTKLSRQSFSSPAVGQVGELDLSSLIEEVVAPLREDKLVQVHVIGRLGFPMLAVREQIQQVLLNVVLNARQAITGQGSISIAVMQSNGSAIITVDDTGGGVLPHMLDNLFRPSQSSRPGGLGVGLYQCKKIIEAHGGTIQLRSEEGKGTQVQIALPLAPMTEHSEVVNREA